MRDRDVVVREVGPRDGLQSLSTVLPTADKLVWLRAEAAAGVREIEVGSFVPAGALPQLADTTEVVAGAKRIGGFEVAALVPNLRGTQAAVTSGVDKINGVVSVSEDHNRSNLRRTTAESMAEIGRTVAFCRQTAPDRRPLVGVALATSFGCTIGGAVPEGRVRDLAAELARFGPDEIVLADTVGYGNPAAVKRLFSSIRADLGPEITIGAHFHDTRGTGLANVVAALDAGIRHFDASLGGLGGCPYAPGATGNIATEDLVHMLEAMGLRTGIDLERLLEVRRVVQGTLPGAPFEGALARAGIPMNYAAARGAAA